RVRSVLWTGRESPRLQQQVPAGEEPEQRARRQHRRAGVLIAREPVDRADDDEEGGDAEIEERFDLHVLPAASTRSPYFWSKNGRSERIGGSESKLRSGGGEVVAHSSVWPSQGSLPAGRPWRSDRYRFQAKNSTLTAMMNEPIVEIRLRFPKPSLSRYVTTRRGIPSNPSWCWTRNVMLNPMNRSQKCHLPSRSSIILPVNFGNQQYNATNPAQPAAA